MLIFLLEAMIMVWEKTDKYAFDLDDIIFTVYSSSGRECNKVDKSPDSRYFSDPALSL